MCSAKKMAVRLVAGIPAIFAVIFIPAGTLAYWKAGSISP